MRKALVRTRPRWLQLVVGLVVGVLAAAVVFSLVRFVSDDPVEGIETTYRLSDLDELGPSPVSLISIRDIRQPSSVPGLAAPTGDRFVTLVIAVDRQDTPPREWIALEDFRLSLYVIDGSGEREELTPTDNSVRLLDGIGGRIHGSGPDRVNDPYWIELEYEPPSGDVDEYGVDLGVDGEEFTFTVRAEEAP